MIQLYTARNKAATTYTYMFNPYNGKLVLVCASLGFPIPATTQLTNPIKLSGYNTSVALPQAEPNGLYSPPSTHGTWVMCMGQGGQVEPAYIEQDVLAFTRPMQGEAVQAIVPQEGGKPSITLNPNR